MFSFAKRQGYTQRNPIADVERAKEHGGEVGILTVAETARLLECAEKDTLPYWAIGAFAGLRSAEIERIEWKDIDFEAGLIEGDIRKPRSSVSDLLSEVMVGHSRE
ncbi:MAG: hypothetical protein ABI318_11610 [Chthoniobacteraceae bacterium]